MRRRHSLAEGLYAWSCPSEVALRAVAFVSFQTTDQRLKITQSTSKLKSPTLTPSPLLTRLEEVSLLSVAEPFYPDSQSDSFY